MPCRNPEKIVCWVRGLGRGLVDGFEVGLEFGWEERNLLQYKEN